MFKKSTLVALITMGSVALSLNAYADQLSGTYNCSGVDPTFPKTGQYTSTITVTPMGKAKNVYQMFEKDDFNHSSNEIGVIEGKNLVFAFQQVGNPSTFGTEVLKISNNGKNLDGYYYYWGKFDQKATESCV